jgi:hypothetical protein
MKLFIEASVCLIIVILLSLVLISSGEKKVKMNLAKGPRIIISDKTYCYWNGKEVSIKDLQKQIDVEADGVIGCNTISNVQLWYIINKAIKGQNNE